MNERMPMFQPGQPEMPNPEKMDAPEFEDVTDDTIVPSETTTVAPEEMEGFESFEKAA